MRKEMRKKICKKIVAVAIGSTLLGMTAVAHATMFVDRTVSYGGMVSNLIYDDILDITWLDYTRSADTMANQEAWVADLSFEFDGTTYADWRLPVSYNANNGLDFANDGSGTTGYGVTSSEMGHLFHDLGNVGHRDENGVNRGDGTWGLLNSGSFINLDAGSDFYMSGTKLYSNSDSPIDFNFQYGLQYSHSSNSGQAEWLALAVMDGRIVSTGSSNPTPTPEPATMLLFGAGLICLAAFKVKKYKK
jgi:hypothetical protein